MTSDVNNGRSSDMTNCFYVAVGHLKFEIFVLLKNIPFSNSNSN